MSTAVMAACWPLKMHPTQKAVLMSLADNANDHGECWPALSTIAERTCLGRSTVIRAVEGLERAGHLKADRSSGRHTRYIVTPNLGLFSPNPSRSGTRPALTPVPQRDPSRSGTGICQPVEIDSKSKSDPSRSDTRPAAGPVPERDTNQELRATSKARAKEKSKETREKRALPDWLPDDLWRDWVEYRKGGKGRFTEKAEALSLRTLTKLRDAGHDPRRVIELAIERGWTGLFAPRDDAVSARGSPGKPAIAQQFTAKTYMGTADNELPPHLRA